MANGKFSSVVLAFVLATAFLSRAAAAAHYRPDRILILPKSDTETSLKKLRVRKGHRVSRKLSETGVELIELEPGQDPLATAREYSESGLVEFAEPDYQIHATAVPNDPGFANCWGLNNSGQAGGTVQADVRAELAWNTRNSAEDVIVAVIDSGVRYTHEDLAANMWHNPQETPDGQDDDKNGIVDDIYGIDAFASSGDPWDDFGHGTHVAGTIGAVGNNGKGVAGVCWRVKIMALKFLASDGNGDTSDAVTCINYAIKHGARVINASWASSQSSYALKNAIAAARNAGIIFVTAAGNEAANNDGTPSYPANYNLDNIVTVAAVDRNGSFDSSYSNWGAKTVDLAAPGTAIYSTSSRSDHDYEWMTGTSMATPHVTGAIALLRAAYPTESYTSIIQRLYAAVDQAPSLKGKCVTEGRLNIGNLFPHRWNVSAEAASGGSISFSTDAASFAEGSVLQVFASPAAGFSFQSWGGDLNGTNNPASLLVNADKRVLANFVRSSDTSGSSLPSPTISAVRLTADGSLEFALRSADFGLVVESSSDLAYWELVVGDTSTNVLNVGPPASARRFFRARPR